ncbi:hypothetical protein ABZ419_27235 [Streptomyces cinnamoneus]|uniref:hypothetical protein n=1 Tax=Streptomyces cinnamoneus TaxID=53446 RepID=UPI0034036B95
MDEIQAAGPSVDQQAQEMLREAEELAWEAAGARVQDANLVRLRQEDQDADVIFPDGTPFTDALVDDDAVGRLGKAIEQYGGAKHRSGRMDLFYRLFEGIDEVRGDGPTDLPR